MVAPGVAGNRTWENEPVPRLTELLGREVVDAAGVRAGRLVDLAVDLGEVEPTVLRVLFRKERRGQLLEVPWVAVADLGPPMRLRSAPIRAWRARSSRRAPVRGSCARSADLRRTRHVFAADRRRRSRCRGRSPAGESGRGWGRDAVPPSRSSGADGWNQRRSRRLAGASPHFRARARFPAAFGRCRYSPTQQSSSLPR